MAWQNGYSRGWFITGTSTGVGKTVITAALFSILSNKQKESAVFKPVQTGVSEQITTDAEFCYKTTRRLGEYNPELFSPYRFRYPASPHLAAQREGKKIDPGLILRHFKKLKQHYRTLLIEGAGGVLVPLTKQYFMADLIRDLRLPVILVSLLKLGTINHTLLTIRFLKSVTIPIVGIVFNRVSRKLSLIERDNLRVIPRLSGIPVLGCFPELKGINVEKGRIGNLRKEAVRANFFTKKNWSF